MQTYVALLRGINVGGRNKLGMAPLRELCGALGHREVVTYIQSGNVVFQSRITSTAKVAADLAKAIRTTFSLEIPVVVRRHEELAETLARNPFRGVDLTRVYVVFLDAVPTPAAIATLDMKRSPPDEVVVRGHDVYLHCPAGFGQTKFTIDYFERKLGATATARNWATLTKLTELSG